MSLHVVEDLIEQSIRLLHVASPKDDRRVRERIATLYRYQDVYDCSFTHFRLLDILLERGFTHRFELRQHPEYSGRADYFEQLTEFTALAEIDPEEDPSGWLEDGYVDPPHLYCDAGTALWRTMIQSGQITGSDAEPLAPAPLAEVVHEVVRAAEHAGDVETIALWHALGWHGITEDAWLDHPRDDPALAAIRDIALRTGATTFELVSGYRPTPAYYEDDPIEAWWFGDDTESH
ncbi:hypothetical protein ABZ319_11005 [Nocardia sp. NPDC005978]|uniref:hypothetical protein n=1 Tax=Nocardia sp. NPDC005978 TaxID=3156725 RepID=UPI0033AB40A8